MALLWGCIADDVTGATDLATNFVRRGYRTTVVVSDEDRAATVREAAASSDVVVIATRIRHSPPHSAVLEALAAWSALAEADPHRYYFKYCSTFDSTADGNIGPVIDAFLGVVEPPHTIVVPSFPDAGRTVYRGHLFVYDDRLDDSPMRDHPINPMRDSSLLRLLRAQSSSTVDLLTRDVVVRGPEAVRAALAERSDAPRATVVDAIDNDDLVTIMEAASELRLVTGGSGLALGMPPGPADHADMIEVRPGERAVIVGSVSEQSRVQTAHAMRHQPVRLIDIGALRSCAGDVLATAEAWVRDSWRTHDEPPVVAIEPPRAGTQPSHEDARLVERSLAGLASMLVSAGAGQLIIAGGETSGAVMDELRVRSLRIGPALAPGLAWSQALRHDGSSLAVVLKSGNFGRADLFTSAWAALGSTKPVSA